MNIINYYQLLLLLCILSIYYNVFLSIFKFDYVKIVDIEIKKHIQYNVNTNTSISIFIANLQNNHNCVIDIPNKIMLFNIKKNIKSKKKNYYTIINNRKNNICSTLDNIIEIILIYISFYISIISFSIITLYIIVEYFTIGMIINNYNNLTSNNDNDNDNDNDNNYNDNDNENFSYDTSNE